MTGCSDGREVRSQLIKHEEKCNRKTTKRTHGKQTQMVMQKSVALTITRHLEGLRQIFFTVWVSLLRLCK